MPSFPLSLPATPDLLDFTMRPARSSSSHESPFSFQQEVQVFSGRKWEVQFTLPRIVNRSIAEDWITTLLLLDGREGTILIGDPDATSFMGDLTGSTPVVNGGSQTGKLLSIGGLAISKSGIMLPGDYFQLGSGETTRLYKVLEQVDSDASGIADVNIWPNLRESPSDAEALVTSNPKGTFRLDSTDMGWSTDSLSHYQFQFSFREAV